MPRVLDIEQKAIAGHYSDLKREFDALNRGMEGDSGISVLFFNFPVILMCSQNRERVC